MIGAEHLERAEGWTTEVGGASMPLVGTYADVEIGALLSLVGSGGTLEVSLRDGDAAAHLKAERFEVVGDDPARADLAVAELGVRVEIATPADDAVFESGRGPRDSLVVDRSAVCRDECAQDR